MKNSNYTDLIKNIERVIAFLMLLMFVCILIIQISWPFNVDQGMFSFVGSVIADGGVSYKDAWEVKGPVVHFIYAISEMIFGNKYSSIRIFDFFLVSISSFFMYKILSDSSVNVRIAKRYAIFLACIYGISFYPDNWASAQPDGWVAMILPIIFYSFIRNDMDISKISSVFVGVLLCLITFIKPFYILFIIVVFAGYYKNITDNKGKITNQLLFVMIGGLFTFTLLLVYFLSNNALTEFIDVFIIFNLNTHKYVSVGGAESIRNSLFLFFVNYERGVLLLFSIMGLLLAIRNKNTNVKLYITWILFAIICVFVQGKYIYYQFFIFIPVIIIMSGYLFHIIDNKFPKKGINLLLMLVIFILSLSNGSRIWNINQSVKYHSGEITQQQYYSRFPIVGKDKNIFNSSVNDIIRVADYLKQNSSNKDTIQIWGLESGIYFLSGISPATRFGHLYPFVVGSKQSRNKYKKEFLKKIITVRPKYIIVTNNDTNELIKKSSQKHLTDFIGFNEFIKKNYRVKKKIGDYDIFLINGI